MLPSGIYKHFRNQKEYKVLCIAKSEADETDLVIYEALYDEHAIWARPLSSFIEIVEHDGIQQSRFQFLRDS